VTTEPRAANIGSSACSSCGFVLENNPGLRSHSYLSKTAALPRRHCCTTSTLTPCDAVADQTNLLGGCVRHVDNTPADEWPTSIDANSDRLSARHVSNTQARAKRKASMSRCQFVGIETFDVGSSASMRVETRYSKQGAAYGCPFVRPQVDNVSAAQLC
jgi:hypothetical protein